MSGTSDTSEDVSQLHLGTELTSLFQMSHLCVLHMCLIFGLFSFTEIYFLIAKFLGTGPCQRTAEVSNILTDDV